MNVPSLNTIFDTESFRMQLKDWVSSYYHSVKDLDFGPAVGK